MAQGSSKTLNSLLTATSASIQSAAAAEALDSINGLTAKSTPVGADVIVVGDSAASYAGKKATLTEAGVIKTYITEQVTNTRVTGAGPSSLGNYRSYLRAASARTYSETNGAPTTGPSTSNGYLLYANRSYAAGDTNNEPSRYEIYIGTGKTPVFEFYKNTGRTGKIFPDMFYAWAGGNYDGGCLYGYDPASGVAWVTKAYPSGGTVSAGMDETTVPIAANIYFDIKC